MNEVLKISDFGTCRQLTDISTKMSFAGTVAWMAPEIIRHEPCSEKVDIWSFGVVLWELLTREIPYKDVDSSAIIWGVGNNSLHLPVPNTCPESFRILLKQCWSSKPRNRPSFHHIQLYLETAVKEIVDISPESFLQRQANWRSEIEEYMQSFQDEESRGPLLEEELVRQRRDELRHAQDIREHYERKLERANNLYMELATCLLQLEQRERDLLEREEHLQEKATLDEKTYKKHIMRPLLRAHERLTKKRALKSQQSKSPDEESEGLGAPEVKKVSHLYLSNPGLGRSSGQAAVYIAETPPLKDVEAVCDVASSESAVHHSLAPPTYTNNSIRKAVVYNTDAVVPSSSINNWQKTADFSEHKLNSNIRPEMGMDQHCNYSLKYPSFEPHKLQKNREKQLFYDMMQKSNRNNFAGYEQCYERNGNGYEPPNHRLSMYESLHCNPLRFSSMENLRNSERQLPEYQHQTSQSHSTRNLAGSYNDISCVREQLLHKPQNVEVQDGDGNILKKRWYHNQVSNPSRAANLTSRSDSSVDPVISGISNIRLLGGASHASGRKEWLDPHVHRHLRRHTMIDSGTLVNNDPSELNRLNRNSLPPMCDNFENPTRDVDQLLPASQLPMASPIW